MKMIIMRIHRVYKINQSLHKLVIKNTKIQNMVTGIKLLIMNVLEIKIIVQLVA